MKKLRTEIVLSWVAMAISLAAPLLILPLVSRAFDKSGFGDYLYLLAASSIFTILCDYGFNITTTRRIARCECAGEVNRIATKTLTIKLFFIVIASILVSFLLTERAYLEIIFVILFGVISTLQPTWFFLGLNKNSINALLTAFGRLFTCVLVFMFITSSSSVIQIMVMHVVGGIISLMCAWLYLIKKVGFRFSRPTLAEIGLFFKSDFYISISTLAVAGYTTLPIILLGHISGVSSVAEYASVEKIFKAIEYVLTTALTVVFPVMAKEFTVCKYKAISMLSRLSFVVFTVGLFIVVFSVLAGKQLLSLYYGPDYNVSIVLIVLMSFVPMLGALAVTWGNLGVVNIGQKDKVYFLTIAAGSVLNILLIFLLAGDYGSIGGAIALFVSSSFITLIMWSLLRHEKKLANKIVF